jgi:hypothetical protein
MIQARPPGTAHVDIESGMQFHWRTDEVFHRSPAFLTLTRQAVLWLSARSVRSGSALAVAHVGVEVMLDAALSGDARAQRAYRAALESGARDGLGRHVSWASGEQLDRFDALRGRLLARGAITADIAPETVAERLRSALATRPRLALDDASVQAVRDWARVARADITASAAPLIDHLAAQLL